MEIIVNLPIILFVLFIIFLVVKLFYRKQPIKERIEMETNERIEKQNSKNRDFILKILERNNTIISEKRILELIYLFKEWQKTQEKICSNASNRNLKIYKNYGKNRSRDDSGFYYATLSDNPPEEIHKPILVYENVFTEPFRSTHDMDSFALSEQVSSILSLTGVKKEETKIYYIHKKEHFVNHKLVYGLILFDVYRLEY